MKNPLVKRSNAPNYILMMVVSFAATVVLTRYYLAWTGYPQIGCGELHIAHLLWGGLAMFIDEVGKFITATNDYFYPAAAPLIYGVFLLTMLLYFELGRHADNFPRARLYAVFDQLPVVGIYSAPNY